VLSLPDRAEAIPAFARKYKTSCVTCHLAVPKRNAFGEAFRRNGYTMPAGDAEFVKQEPISLGAPSHKRTFPNAVWPGTLPAEFPLSAYVHQRFTQTFGDSEESDRSSFDMPHELELVMGGTFGESFAFMGEYVLFEDGMNAPGLGRLFFQANDLVGPDNLLNVRFGRMEPGITDGRTDNNRIMLEHTTTLNYSATGHWRPRDLQSGIEASGIVAHRYQYMAGVVNGEGTVVDDKTDEKDFYARIAAKIGGLPFDGLHSDKPPSLDNDDNWVDNALTAGIYAYQGNIAGPNGADNDFSRFGCDVHAGYERLDMFVGAIVGRDDHPDTTISKALTESADGEPRLRSLAWSFEVYYLVFPWLISGLRVGGASSERESLNLDDFTTVSPHLTVVARANVRFTAEGLIKMDRSQTIEALSHLGPLIEAEGDQSWKMKWIKLNAMFVF
jgi:hypothetical protein